MFVKNPDGSVGDNVRAILDWQIMNEGRGQPTNHSILTFLDNIMADIARFLTMCADAEVRRQAEKFILQDYYKTVKTIVNNGGIEMPLSFEQVILNIGTQM